MREYLRAAGAWLGAEMNRRRLLRLCLIAGMLAGMLAHGFMFANKIPNHDDLYYDVDITGVGVELGRFALTFFWKLFSNLSTPWLNGVLGVAFLSGAAALLADAFGLRRRWQALSLTLIVVAFPENISLFCFMYEAHVFALGTCSRPAASKTARIVRPPHAGSSARTARMAASISGAVLEGWRCGQRLWSQRRCPSAARFTHLYPVFRLTPNSRHRADMLFSPREASSTKCSLCSSTVLISQGILPSSFSSPDALFYMKTVTYVSSLLLPILLLYTL